MKFICCLKYFLSRALAAILTGRAESFEVLVILWVHRYKMFFFLISNTFINNGDFAIQIIPIKNI